VLAQIPENLRALILTEMIRRDTPMNRRDEVIATERTLLRPFAASDAEDLLTLFRDPDVRRYLLDDVLISASWMHDEIVASDTRFAHAGTGLWSIRLAGDTSIIGFVGFRTFFDPPELQLLYGLLPGYWGRGLATEAAARICHRAFQELGFFEITAAIDIPNQASARVLRRLGMRQVRTSNDGAAGTAFFAVSRDYWQQEGHDEQR
jgi:ribosomal-protein-alanine N-acetyltransferase